MPLGNRWISSSVISFFPGASNAITTHRNPFKSNDLLIGWPLDLGLMDDQVMAVAAGIGRGRSWQGSATALSARVGEMAQPRDPAHLSPPEGAYFFSPLIFSFAILRASWDSRMRW